MTTLEELKQMRPVDSHDLQRLVNEMHAEARVFQLQELRKERRIRPDGARGNAKWVIDE